MITAANRLFQVGGFSPLSLAPALWLSDTGSNAAQWDDLSGNGRHATQATGINQPAIVANALNGRQVRRFDGTNDFFSYPSAVFSYTGAATVFVVTATTTAASGEYGAFIAEYPSGTVSSNAIACSPNRFPNAEFRPVTDVYAPGGVEHGANYTTTVPHIVCWSWSNWSTHKTNGKTVIRVDGQAGTPAAYGGNPASATRSIFTIGRLDSTNLVASFLGMDLAELIVYPTQLTAAQRQAVERYLSQKYAITI